MKGVSHDPRGLQGGAFSETAVTCRDEIKKCRKQVHLHRLKAVGSVALAVVCAAVGLAALALVVYAFMPFAAQLAVGVAIGVSTNLLGLLSVFSFFVAPVAVIFSMVSSVFVCDAKEEINRLQSRIKVLEGEIASSNA